MSTDAMKAASAGNDSAVPGTSAQAAGNLPDHHVPGAGAFGPRFRNPWDTHEDRGFSEVLKWKKEQRKAGIPTEGRLEGNLKPTQDDYRRAFPLQPVDWAALAAPPSDGVQAVWVGHATLLVQMGGLTFITDPCFSERCSPVQFAGPKRVVPPALNGTEPQLPPLDFVLLSHNHYDHLDSGSVRTLDRRYGKALTWYVPLGLKAWFDGEGVKGRVTELDWWQSVEHTGGGDKGKSVSVTMVPAQHWSARGVLDRSRTLWGGYVVTAPRPPTPPPAPATASATASAAGPSSEPSSASSPNPLATSAATAAATATVTAAPGSGDGAAAAAAAAAAAPLRFYFVGDTGYCPVFKEIGERFGPIDLAAVPIGAYDPRWFMKPQHTNSEEGLQIAQDVRALVSVGVHTATWCLTDEPLDEPPTRLAAAVREAGLSPTYFMTLQHGEKAVVVGGRLVNSPKTLPAKA